MTSTPVPAPVVRARPSLRVLPVVGGALACAALLAALVFDRSSTIGAVAVATLSLAAAAVFGTELVRRGAQVVRAPEGRVAVLVGLAGLVILALFTGLGLTLPLVIALGFGVLGGALVGRGVRLLNAVRGEAGTPWQALKGLSAAERSRLMWQLNAPLLGGLLAAIVAFGVDPAGAFVAFVAVAAVTIWRLSRQTVVPTARIRTGARPPDEVAAHLHDSVLQTLALIQRNAADSTRVTQLARQQERSLRAWLAGTDEHGDATTLAGALRAAAAQVEADVPGAAVDVVTVGDRPLERRTEMLVQAAREAMRNAASHGTPQVRVFSEIDAAGVRVFVRDTGSGFSLDRVPEDRRGVRDAIIGRMGHVDGTVVIDSGDAGTEIELHLPDPRPNGH